MSVRIYLSNQNPSTSQIKIYRDTKRIEDAALPAPIAILPGNAKYFDETDYLFYDVDYFYRVEIIDSAGVSLLMPNQVKRLGIDVGPGPETLIAGDETLGLFGVFNAFDYGNEIPSVFKNIPWYTTISSSTRIIKYIRNGRISYTYGRFPVIQPSVVYANNWYKSTNSNPFAAHATTQAYFQNSNQVPVVVQNRKFDYHIPKLFNDGNTDRTYANYTHATPKGYSEAIDLVRVFGDFPGMVAKDKVPFKFNTAGTSGNGNFVISCADSDITTVPNRSMGLSVTTAGALSIISNHLDMPSTNNTSYYGFVIVEYLGVE